MRALACVLLLALAADALPPLVPGFVRLRDLRSSIATRAVEMREKEDFDRKPREERMLLTFRKREMFEGKEITGKLLLETCLGWEDVEQEEATADGKRVLALLPAVLKERYARTDDRRERRTVSRLLLKALDSEYRPVREAAIASLRAIYPPPADDRYAATMTRKERVSPIRAWKRHVADQR